MRGKLNFLLIGNTSHILIYHRTQITNNCFFLLLRLFIFSFCSSANATPDFEGRGGDELAEEVASSLTAAYKSKNAFDLSQLCILKGRKCWKLYVDILVNQICFLFNLQ